MSGKGLAPAASDDLDDAGGAAMSDTGAGETAAGDGADEESSTTLLTVQLGSDGSFTLIQGDESESDDAAVASPDGGVAPEGQSFDAIGPLLKAIGDILKNAQSAGGGTDDENFDQGFASKGVSSAS